MKETIENLWNGNIAPGEICGAGNPDIEHLVMLLERNKENLDKELGEQQKEILKKYIDCTDEYIYRITELAFCDGFCLASRLWAEAFQ